MKQTISILTIILTSMSCKQYIKKEHTEYVYHNIANADTLSKALLLAVTDEEYLQYGANVAYISTAGDTIIPFGDFAYFGTDTLEFFANVLQHPNDSTFGRAVSIDQHGNTLFDVVTFDNGPDYFHEGLVRVLRNGKMGFANKKGEVVIPCQYDFAGWFEGGTAKVTFESREYYDLDEHLRIESDSWLEIDKQGNRIE